MSLQGKRELLRRFDALRRMGQPIAQRWADTTARSARRRVPVKTGALQRSIRVRTTSAKGAIVVGRYTGYFVDAGTVAHSEKPKRRKGLRAMKFTYGSRPQFARKVNHPATRARPFRVAAAQDGLRENPMAAVVVKLWNDAA